MPPKMDLSVVAAYGDDIWNNKAETDMLDDKDDAPKSPEIKPKSKKKRNGQDRVVSAQIYLAIAAIVAILTAKFVFPGLFQKLYDQYVEFVSETPVWNLDGIVDAFSSDNNVSILEETTQ